MGNTRDNPKSLINHVDILKTITPKGDIFNPVTDGMLDRLYQSIGEILDGVIDDIKALIDLRNPLKTACLDDLEREYGITPSSFFTELERRKYLNALVFTTRGNGSKDYIQKRLVDAGFPVTVIQNDPPRDPLSFLVAEYSICCIPQSVIDANQGISYCQKYPYGSSVCSFFDAGELFVDGVTDYSGKTSIDPTKWSHVFFIGGTSLGGLLLDDWNMEYKDCSYWPGNSGSNRVKDTVIKNNGNRSIKVSNLSNVEEQELYPDPLDASLVAAFRMYDLKQDLGFSFDQYNNAPMLSDWNMNSETVDDWPVIGGATRVKTDADRVANYINQRSLSVQPISVLNSGVRRSVLEINTEYTLTMWTRVKYDILPAVVNGTQAIYDSTGNGYSSHTWINITVDFVAETEDLDFVVAADHNLSEPFQMDEVILHKKIQDNVVTDGNMEAITTTAWEALADSILSKSGDYRYTGNKCLSVFVPNPYTGGVRQKCLEIGKRYYCCAFAATLIGYEVGFAVGMRCGTTLIAETPATDMEYFKIEGIVTAESEYLDFYFSQLHDEYEDVIFVVDNVFVVEVALHEVKNIAPVNIMLDGDMEVSTTTNWSAGSSATLSKYAGDRYQGIQCLKITYNGVANPYAYQYNKITEVGKYYLIVCASKGDGACTRSLRLGSSKILKQWDNSVTWDLYTAVYYQSGFGDTIRLYSEASSAGQYSYFDNVKIIPLDPNGISLQIPQYPSNFNRFVDGNCEDIVVTRWYGINYAIKSKVTSPVYSGLRSLYVDNDGIHLNNGVRQQVVLVIGKTYYVVGKVKKYSIDKDSYIRVSNGTTTLWNGSYTDSGWQSVNIVFTATADYIDIKMMGTELDSFYVDEFYCFEIDPINEGAINHIEPSGRSLEFANEKCINANLLGINLVDKWTIVFVVEATDINGVIISRSDMVDIQWEIGITIFGEVYTDGTTGTVVSNALIPNTGVYHVVITHDTTDTRIYIDGELDNTGSISCTQKTNIKTFIGSFGDEDRSSPLKGKMPYLAMYGIKQSADWVYGEYNKWLDVLWSGSVARESKSGIQQLSMDLEFYQQKKRAEIWLEGKDCTIGTWVSNGQYTEGFTLVGTGDEPDKFDSEFSSDKSMQFYAGKYYIADDTTIGNIYDYAITVLIYTSNYGVICSKQETAGYVIEILSDYKVRMTYNSGAAMVTSTSALPINTWCLVSIYASRYTNKIYMYSNGVSILSNNTLPSYTSLINNAPLSIGDASSNIKISLFSLWKFSLGTLAIVPGDIPVQEYQKYITLYQPEEFPTAGAYVEQLIPEYKIPKYITQPGLKNIIDDDSITISNLTEKPIFCYRGNDAIETDAKWWNYKKEDDTDYALSEYSTGDAILYQDFAEFSEDRSVKYYKNGIYHRSSDAYLGYIRSQDFIIELVVKINNTTATNTRIVDKYYATYNYGYYIEYNPVNTEYVITLGAGSTPVNISTVPGALNDTWHHLLFIVKMTSGSSRYGIAYLNGVPNTPVAHTLGEMNNSSVYLSLKSTEGEVNVALCRMWARYEWIDSVEQGDLAEKLAGNYKNGGLSFPSPIPLTAYTWGDHIGTIPMIMAQDYNTGEWKKICVGSTRNSKQILTAQMEEGMSGIRLYPKYELLGHVNFDDIDVNQLNINFIELPKEKRRLFYHLLGQSKPLSTWAALLIRWV